MIVGVDASNIGVAGGATHLVEVISALTPEDHGIEKVHVWAREHLHEGLPSKPWLHVKSPSVLNKSLAHRLWWQQVKLAAEAEEQCDVLFVPGGLYLGRFRPYVTMMRNMLPFDPGERARFGVSFDRFRYHLLEWGQRITFENAAGTIFLSHTAREAFTHRHGQLEGESAVIPHGVDTRFAESTANRESSNPGGDGRPFRWMYVSPIRLYKHQWNIARAVADLRSEGYDVKLDLVGHSKPHAMKKLKAVLREVDPDRNFISYHGRVPHRKIDELYRRADAFVFASTCETFGQVLTEAMQAGLPIACSNQSAAPEVVGDAGVYFDPERPCEIANAMRRLMDDNQLRKEKEELAHKRAQDFSWEQCAHKTFSVIAETARQYSA